MLIYRAMCEEEYLKSKSGKASFDIKRFKWFSHNLEWIKSRVMDGKFNNSKFVKGKYEFLCEFEWDEKRSDIWRKNEIQFDRRRNPTIRFLKLLER